MWKKLPLLAMMLVGTLWAQPTLTTVTDTVYMADGTLAEGRLLVDFEFHCIQDTTNVPIAVSNFPVAVSSGVFTVTLPANSTCNDTYYEVRYELRKGPLSDSHTEQWVVGTSTPAALGDVITSNPSGPSATFPMSQLTGTLPLSKGGTNNSSWTNSRCVQVASDGSKLESASAACGVGGGAPTDATYITQTANGTLTDEQALAALSSGFMRVATTTGVITSITDSAGVAANISDETGTGSLVFSTAPAFTGATTADVGSHTWSPLTKDMAFGDADEGQISLGTLTVGQANQTISTTVLDDVGIFYNNAAVLAEDISFIFFGPSDLPRFVLAAEGADLATYNPRSMVIGPAATIGNVDENILCSTNFSNIDCDTGGTGADLGVQDDLEVGGKAFLADLATTGTTDFSGASSFLLPSDAVDAITELAAALKSGADTTLITGTAGASGNCSEWNADGDLVDSGGVCGGGGGSGTVNSGTESYLTYYAGTGTAVSELPRIRFDDANEEIDYYDVSNNNTATIDLATGLPIWGKLVTTGIDETLGIAGDTGPSSFTGEAGDGASNSEPFNYCGYGSPSFLSCFFPCDTDGFWCISSTKATADSADFVRTLQNTTCQPSGGTDTFACTTTPAFSAYVEGPEYCFKSDAANTGAASINMNAIGALPIKLQRDQDPANNAIEDDQWVCGVYDGINFQMTSQSALAGGGETTTAEDWLDLTGSGVDFRPSLRDMEVIHDTFVGGDDNTDGSIGDLGWKRDLTGTAGIDRVSGTEGHPGAMTLSTGGTDSSLCILFLSDAIANDQFFGMDDETWSFQAYVKVSTTSNVRVHVGLCENHGCEANQGFYFEFDTGTSANWYAVTHDGTDTSTDTSTAATTNWVDLEIRCASSSCDFFIDGVEVVSNQTTDLEPNDVGVTLSIDNLTAADINLMVDSWLMWWER
ncbi:MAG: hypothetical protein GY906_22425 [bacterium]|nr:hypothetical protein [bacterium]